MINKSINFFMHQLIKNKFVILIYLFKFLNIANSQNWVLSTLIPKDYNKLQVPLQNGTKLTVNSSITINSFVVTEKTQVCTKFKLKTVYL